MWHMGVDTTTNPASHTQAQSIIKAQKDGGSPRFSNRAGKRERRQAGRNERAPYHNFSASTRTGCSQRRWSRMAAAMNSRPRSTGRGQSVPGGQPRRDGGGQGTARSMRAHIPHARAVPFPQHAAVRAASTSRQSPSRWPPFSRTGAPVPNGKARGRLRAVHPFQG